jgi:hypothetical protein
METDYIELLVTRAHRLFGNHSIYEIIDMNEAEARQWLFEKHRNARPAVVEAYLKVVAEIRIITETGNSTSGQ